MYCRKYKVIRLYVYEYVIQNSVPVSWLRHFVHYLNYINYTFTSDTTYQNEMYNTNPNKNNNNDN